MAFISSIKIRGFRSIPQGTLNDLGGLAALVGRNSSGKSNVLRAISLFFSNEVEPGSVFDSSRDFYYRLNSKKKREVEVAVEFDLPETFNFRPGTEAIEQKLGRQFTIVRSWSFDSQRLVQVHTSAMKNGEEVIDGALLAEQFLTLLNFRYITNRIQPRDVLALESKRLAGVLVRRIRRTEGIDAFLESLQSTAGRFLQPANTALNDSGAPMADMEMATAQALGEMLQVGGLRATGKHGRPVEDEDWGAGHQALGLYEVLRLLDTDYGTNFGWKQATLWLIEEPESGLHQELQTYLAGELADWAGNPDAKHQIVMTTHSPVFTMAASCGYWVEMDETGNTALVERPIHNLVRDATERGVSPWTQPVLSYPDRTVVLVEGGIDADALEHTAGLAGLTGYKFLPLPKLDPAVPRGGADQIVTYLKNYGGLISHRQPTAPFVVLMDWDVSDAQMGQAQKAYGDGGDRRVIRADEAHADPDLGPEFRGVERFYPVKLIEAAESDGEIALLHSKESPRLSVRKRDLDAAKGSLRDRLLALTELDDLTELAAVLDQVISASR